MIWWGDRPARLHLHFILFCWVTGTPMFCFSLRLLIVYTFALTSIALGECVCLYDITCFSVKILFKYICFTSEYQFSDSFDFVLLRKALLFHGFSFELLF